MLKSENIDLPHAYGTTTVFRQLKIKVNHNTKVTRQILRDLIAATGLVILLKFVPNHRFFSPCDIEIWWMTLKILGHIFYTKLSIVHHFKSIGEFKLKLQSGNAQFGSKLAIFCVPCDHEIWWMTLKNNKAPLLYYIKLCASFQSHGWIQTGVTVRKRSIRVKIGNFLSRVTLKFDGWPWKTIGHLFYVAPSFVHNFIAISEFKLELRVRKRPIWVKINDFLAVWPSNLTDGLEKT